MRTKYQPRTLDAELLTKVPDYAAEANDATRILARHALRDLPFYEMTVPGMGPGDTLSFRIGQPFIKSDSKLAEPLQAVAIFVLLGPVEKDEAR